MEAKRTDPDRLALMFLNFHSVPELVISFLTPRTGDSPDGLPAPHLAPSNEPGHLSTAVRPSFRLPLMSTFPKWPTKCRSVPIAGDVDILAELQIPKTRIDDSQSENL
jgi:hypothetical protein